MDDAPGKILRETERAATYFIQSPLDFEGKIQIITNRTHALTPATRRKSRIVSTSIM